MARRRGRGTCAYCGATATTIDHVVPRCLFAGRLPADVPKVPACARCNNEKSKYDDYLRDMLVLDIAAGGSPVAQSLVDTVVRSTRKRHSKIGRVAKAVNPRAVYSKAGIYLGHYPIIPIEAENVRKILSFIAKGLYYHIKGSPMAPDLPTSVVRIYPTKFAETWEAFRQIGSSEPRLVGSDVFGFSAAFDRNDPKISAWLMWFYGTIAFAVWVGIDLPPAAEADPLDLLGF